MAGELKHSDVGPELTYDKYHSTTSHTIDGVDAGTVIAGKVALAEVKADTDIADAISKKHSNALDHANTLDHAQGTDQGLDTGGANAVTAAEVKGAVTNSHAPGSDNQVIPDQLSDLSDDSTHRLVTDTEKLTWNAKSNLALGETETTAYRGDRGKTAYDHSQVAHAPSTAEANVNADWTAASGDAQILNKPTIPDELADLSDDSTHRLVTDTEKSTWNGKTDLTTVKADTDIASAISLKHASGSDNQDLSGYSLTTHNHSYNNLTDKPSIPEVIDEDDMASNLDTRVPTQQSVKAYVDAQSSSSSSQQLSHGRLTLESGVGVSTTDQTAKTVLYYTPYVGNLIGLYSGTAWEDKTFSEIHIDLTETQSCTTVNGDATLTVADTSQLIVGMEVSGTGIAGGATIASVTDATHLEMSANAIADATNNITFKIPASKVVDVFAYNASGSAKLVFGPLWTDGTTRATAITTKDGVPVLSGTYAISGANHTEGKLRLLGTIKTTATAGQTQFTGSSALVTNIFNLIPKVLISYNSNASWTYNGTSKREYNGGTGQVRAEFVMSLANQSIFMIGAAFAQVGSGETFYCALGYDSTTVFAGTANFAYYIYTVFGPAMAYRTPAIGYHYMTQLEWANAGNTGTNYGQYTGDTLYSQAHVTVMI